MPAISFFIDDDEFAPKAQGFDVAEISPHSHPYCRASRYDGRKALGVAEKAKREKYGDLSNELNIEFHPMAIDICGSIGPGFERGVHLLATYFDNKK